MTSFAAEPSPQEFEKRQRVDCPHCSRHIPVEATMQCQCGAAYKLEMKQITEPAGNRYD